MTQHSLVSSEEYPVQGKCRVGALKHRWCRWFDLVLLLAEGSSSGWCGSAELGYESVVELLHALLALIKLLAPMWKWGSTSSLLLLLPVQVWSSSNRAC